MGDCVGLIGRILGHKFAPRYSRQVASDGLTEDALKFAIQHGCNVTPAFHTIYCGDVCERCGAAAQEGERP